MIGPLLIFDKSFLQMLNPEEVSELSLHFKFVGTPTLIGEIIADLKSEPPREGFYQMLSRHSREKCRKSMVYNQPITEI
jgi:hypothetical protein